MKSYEYIHKKILKELHELLERGMCRHLWKKYGHGYKCFNCDYYTGSNDELNKLIEKELKEENHEISTRS